MRVQEGSSVGEAHRFRTSMPTEEADGLDRNSGVLQKPLRAVVAGALAGVANHCTVP